MTSTPGSVAATIPLAMAALSDHITTHKLPIPVETRFPGPIVGDTRPPAVAVTVDAYAVPAWIASLNGQMTQTTSPIGDGVWHDLTGRAGFVRIRLTWWEPRWVARCVGDDDTCSRVAGTDLEPGCGHGRDLCALHVHECAECVADRQGGDL